jgi:hypothetical protein
MSKIVYVCLRDPSSATRRIAAVTAACERLLPDNLPKVPPYVKESRGIIIGISNPNDLVNIRGNSVAAGHLVDARNWAIPCTGRPDGAYAIFRSDDAIVEIVSDILATRTVWYVITDELFAASTSQRALVTLLGSFNFNPSVVPWMLATGTLGPGYSWDRRLHHVPGAGRVVLNRLSWELREHTEPTQFAPTLDPPDVQEQRVVEAIRHSVQAIDTTRPNVAITLSGGVDCRTILCLIPDARNLHAVTWGLRSSLHERTNDAFIARELAQYFGLEHQYFETDLSDENVACLFDRFLRNGEGRIDHVSGYADGFALWSRLVGAGIHCIVRGDVAFGRPPVRTPSEVRASAEMFLWSDFSNLPPLERFDLPPQTIPAPFQRSHDESLETWRDRLQQQYRVPFLLGALSDLKLPYVEILNPLIANSVVETIRTLPDVLRTNKALLRRIALTLSPDIPFAMDAAVQPGDRILRSPPVVRLLREHLSHDSATSVISADFAAYVSDRLIETPDRMQDSIGRKVRRAAKAWSPLWLRHMRDKADVPATLGHNRLAFRAYLLARAQQLFVDDARVLHSTRQ